MKELRNKTILLISPQSWGKLFISKHHYAVELAKRGNKVYFLNPPNEKRNKAFKSLEIIPSGIERLWLINHQLNFPYALKFHTISLFHFLMKFHVQRIIRAINNPLDIVWSFDLGNLYPFPFFGQKPYKIFHPVDEPLNEAAIASANGCDIIFSVANEILEKYSSFGVPCHFIHHGIAEEFVQASQNERTTRKPLHVGFSGNLTRSDIDQNTLLQIISENPDIQFDIFGPYQTQQSNISGSSDALVKDFIQILQQQPNVQLYGPVDHHRLALEFGQMDLFLICYDIEKDQSHGTNYHKIMEYLSSGKMIVSNNITTYRDRPDLIQMCKSRENNHELPVLFRHVIENLDQFNSPAKQKLRMDFAIDNLYSKQIERIELLLN